MVVATIVVNCRGGFSSTKVKMGMTLQILQFFSRAVPAIQTFSLIAGGFVCGAVNDFSRKAFTPQNIILYLKRSVGTDNIDWIRRKNFYLLC